MDAQMVKQELLENTKQTILLNAKLEFAKLIEELEGDEDLQGLAEYLFNEGFERLSSDNERVMKDLIWNLSQSFLDLVNLFKMSIGYKPIENDKNISEQIGQMIRFINFVKFMQNYDSDTFLWKELKKNIKEIKEFIFNNRCSWLPRTELWSDSFGKMENIARKKKNGFETYYMGGISEIIRTISNKKRHRNAFPKSFKTDFNFFDDFHQIIGIYNLAVYSFIEMIEAWVSIKPFLEQYKGDLV